MLYFSYVHIHLLVHLPLAPDRIPSSAASLEEVYHVEQNGYFGRGDRDR